MVEVCSERRVNGPASEVCDVVCPGGPGRKLTVIVNTVHEFTQVRSTFALLLKHSCIRVFMRTHMNNFFIHE